MSKIGIEAFNIIKQNTGIGYYTKSLIEELSKINSNEYISYLSRDVRNELKVTKCKTYNFDNRFKELGYKHFLMSQVAKKDKLDVYHGTSFYIPKFIKCRSVITVHDLCSIKYPETFKNSRILYRKLFLKDSIKRADKIISVSESTKKDILNYFDVDSRKIEVIYLGARDVFKPVSDECIIKIKKKYGLNKYILSVGTLEPRKNLLSLLKAFNKIKGKLDEDIKLVLVGKNGWLNGDLLREAEKLQDKIVITGYISDNELAALYSGTELFAYPSKYEGFGLPVLEAMSCGANVLTSNISSLPEVVGDIGTLINPLDIDSIAEGIIEALGKDKNIVRENSIKRSENFSWKRCAMNTNNVYNELVE